MQFLVIGRDGTDKEAINRRLAVREAHLALIKKSKEEGHVLYGAAILDDNENRVGSTLICEFDSREQLEQWLQKEPYVIGNVWQQINIERCEVGAAFLEADSRSKQLS